MAASDLTKITLLPTGFTGCTRTNASACTLTMASNRLTSTTPIYINNCQVMYADNDYLKFDMSDSNGTKGLINANFLQVNGQNVLHESGFIKHNASQGWITAQTLNTNALNLTNNPNISIDSSGGGYLL